MPFTVHEFFGVFAAYNAAIWPAQVLAYGLGLTAVGLAFSRHPARGRLIAAVLGLFWLGMGAGYHWLFFADVNPAARWFGVAFVLQGLLFLVQGTLRDRLSFDARGPLAAAGLVLIAYAMVVYPLLGHAAGHGGLDGPQFGVAPCPTTIFTLGMFLFADRRVPYGLLAIPAAWALIGTSAAVALGVPEDYALVAAAVVATAGIVRLNQTGTGGASQAR